MPESAASCSIVSVFSCASPARAGPAEPFPSSALIVCTLSRSTVSATNVTVNDVTLTTVTGTCGIDQRRPEGEEPMSTRPHAPPPDHSRLASGCSARACSTCSRGRPGVDGYLEQVKPTWTVRDCRAEVTDVRHLTPDSVTLTPARQPRLGGLPRRPVRPGRRSRSTACGAPAATRRPRRPAPPRSSS